jgi:hypothetical protein
MGTDVVVPFDQTMTAKQFFPRPWGIIPLSDITLPVSTLVGRISPVPRLGIRSLFSKGNPQFIGFKLKFDCARSPIGARLHPALHTRPTPQFEPSTTRK